jgi:hypothetical protein
MIATTSHIARPILKKRKDVMQVSASPDPLRGDAVLESLGNYL